MASNNNFSNEQLQLLENLFAVKQNPSWDEIEQMLLDHPILENLCAEQIQMWFCYRRIREERIFRESQAEDQKLNATIEIMKQEDELQKKVASTKTNLNIVEPAPNTRTGDIYQDLILLAEETKEEFLLKAKGTGIDWTLLPEIKFSYNTLRFAYVSHNCAGVAARASSFVPLDSVKIMDILKDRASWSRICRKSESFAKFPAGNGGTIELIYMQFDAPTTFADPRDFWNMRYTSTLEDGSLVVCERSLCRSRVSIQGPIDSEFERAKMLASGYLIRPCAGGSILQIVDHMDLQASSVCDMLRPIYESSELLAQKMTVAALDHILLIAKEMSGLQLQNYPVDTPAYLSFSRKISRSFSDAINGLTKEDKWSFMENNDSDGSVIATKPTKNLGIHADYDGVLCIKASKLFEDISPPRLVWILRHHRSEWAGIKYAARSAAQVTAEAPGLCGGPVKTLYIDEDEIMETIQADSEALSWKNYFSDTVSIEQICNGMKDPCVGACSELIFTPYDEKNPNVTLLSSGFRILALGSKTCNRTADWSMKLSRRVNGDTAPMESDTSGSSVSSKSFSVMIACFQIPYRTDQLEEIATMARRYMRHVLATVTILANPATPFGSMPERGHSNMISFAYVIYYSYRSTFGTEFLRCNAFNYDSVVMELEHHQDAILCWSFSGLNRTIYANKEGFKMMGVTLANASDNSLIQIVYQHLVSNLYYCLPTLMRQGYAFLPAGILYIGTVPYVRYDRAVAWRIPKQTWTTCDFFAFAFLNWSII